MSRLVASLIVLTTVATVGGCAVGAEESAPLPPLVELLENGGAAPAVATCQADVLATSGVREVDDLATLDEAVDGLSVADRRAFADCAA